MKRTLILGVLSLFCTFSVFSQVREVLDTTLTLKKLEQRQFSLPSEEKAVKQNNTEKAVSRNNTEEAEYATFTDSRDGEIYKTVKIGIQTWMYNDLKITHYRNGDAIVYAKSRKEWKECSEKGIGAWCYNWSDEKRKSGIKYNWYAVTDNRNLAPEGWHIPTGTEITQLLSRCVDDLDRFYSLVEVSSYCCPPYPANPQNKINLGLELSGLRYNNGDFCMSGGHYGGIWSSTCNESSAYGLLIFGTYVDGGNGVKIFDITSFDAKENNKRKLMHEPFYSICAKGEGLSVRCIKD